MDSAQTSAAPGDLRRDVRPPIETGAAPTPGAAADLRRTARRRVDVAPRLWHQPGGVPLDHPYVRRYWSAIVGPGAVADLMRLATAASRGRSLPRPLHLDTLARHGLVSSDGSSLWVRSTAPRLSVRDQRRLHPRLRTEHALAAAEI